LQSGDVIESVQDDTKQGRSDDDGLKDHRRHESNVPTLSFALSASFERLTYGPLVFLSGRAHSIAHRFGKRRLDRRVSIKASKKIGQLATIPNESLMPTLRRKSLNLLLKPLQSTQQRFRLSACAPNLDHTSRFRMQLLRDLPVFIRLLLSSSMLPVFYSHLTLPTHSGALSCLLLVPLLFFLLRQVRVTTVLA